MAEQFYTILTQIGKAQIANASALGTKVEFKYFALGDGNGNYYNPTENQTELVNEVWRGQIGQVVIDEENPNWIVLETVIPASVGGFNIREAGVFDEDNNLLAIGKYPETYKPKLEDGSAKDLYIRMILEVANTSVVTLKVDPSIILATKKDLENIKFPVKSVNAKTGDIVLKAQDIKANDDKTVEEKLEEHSTQMADLDTKVETHKAETATLIKIKKDVVILATGWIDDTLVSGFWIYNIEDEDIDEKTMVDVNIDLNDLEKAESIKSVTDSFNGYARLYAEEQPTGDIVADIRLTRQVVVNEG